MKKIICHTVLITISLLFPTYSLYSCPTCIGTVDHKTKAPTFFADDYDQYWNLTNRDNAHILEEKKSEKKKGEQ
ncbi:MAG TPA: hypothetical protein VGT41_02995 [Candidatus Babeliales bacterium]|nr:hypothetical protein [Candidatus Babeliales bacterium]